MLPPGGSDLYGASQKICVVRVVGTKMNCPSELVCANKPGWSPTEIVAPWMGFLVAASITVPDAAGETYVVISMQPLSEIRNGRATMCRHLPMCGLTVKLRGRTEGQAPGAEAALSSRARGANQEAHHGSLQRLLDGENYTRSCPQTGHLVAKRKRWRDEGSPKKSVRFPPAV